MKHAEHNPRGFDDELLSMIQQMTPLEIKWLTRLLLKEMKLGMGHKKVLFAYHRDAIDLFNVSFSLQKVCEKLYDPDRRLHEVEVCMFEPFRPMLAERCDVQKVDKQLMASPYHFLETKWDGERCQLHYNAGDFKYFSRNGFEYTDSFGPNDRIGSITPRLCKQLSPMVESVILDGEMMGWNTKLKTFGSKGMNFDVKSLKLGHVHQPCFCAFDVLLLNGNVLTNKPLKERLNILSTVFTPLDGVIMLTESIQVSSRADVMKSLNDAIDNREEGIILKHPESIYKPNLRTGGWYKIKPEYTDGAMTDLDLLIIGGYYGEGRRKGLVSHFLLGVAAVKEESMGDPKDFLAVGRVGSGCTVGELEELGAKLAEHWNKTRAKAALPRGLLWTKEKPDLWIEPAKSCILQVKATEIVRSDAYPVNFTLRFPRIEKVRYDKRWQDCLTLKEFHELRTAASGKLCSTHIQSTSDLPKSKRIKLSQPVAAVSLDRISFDVKRVKRVTNLFEGKEICVFSGDTEITKKEIETKIAENGGKVTQNPGTQTHLIICGSEKNSIRVRNAVSSGKHDIVTVSWFLQCVQLGYLVDFHPKDLICMCEDTSERMKIMYDEYGDSFTEPTTLENLKEVLSRVERRNNEEEPLSAKSKQKLDNLLFDGHNPYAIFRQYCSYFFNYNPEDSNHFANPLNVAAIKFKYLGGTISNDIDERTTNVILHSSALNHLEELRATCNSTGQKISIVSEKWILGSWSKQRCLDEELFQL
ncbi:DNA ligase 4 [Nilaparvata lugens]|uniref:DNA ligase 4 n=1 Tax=Nilaparvata lugens TaxID=108931 RepID=UPI00193DFD90|nr:DNA ligase 4 [Nilaparvata lugens]